MSDNNTSSGCGSSTIFIVFLILKLTHLIDWSWWWVTSPIWIVAGLWLLIVVVAVLLKE